LAEHILIADDYRVNARRLAQLLRLSQYDVVIAEDGFDALLKIADHQPDLLISDLRMPRMSGFELLSVVRRRFPEMPVISMSGDYDPLVLPPCIICDAFFRKGGYESSELLAKVTELLRGMHRPALLKSTAVPVWLPRDHGDYYIVTCTNCLRSFPTRGTTEEEHAVQQTPCIHCETPLTYYIEGRKT